MITDIKRVQWRVSKSQPSCSADWARWLAEQEARTRETYLLKPSLLIADYRREREISHDYEGRELLELLQNASDAFVGTNEPGRVLIELSEDGIIIANNGISFSAEGVESLQTSHLSPKRHSQRRFIGNKGLGFRAVLNWSLRPMILSESLRVAYSTKGMMTRMEDLVLASPELAERVNAERQSSAQCVLPQLVFPNFTVSGDLSQVIDDDTSALLARCEAWLIDGYTTAIGLPFDRPRKFEHAKEQLIALRPEILLFIENLDEIRIIGSDSFERIWKREVLGENVRVRANGDILGEWRIHRTQGKIPQEHLKSDGDGIAEYEIVIAVPCGNEQTTSMLFSYFPTDVELPLPVVCHATLELEQNRKHPQKGASNRYVFQQLAEYLAEVAEEHASRNPQNLWAGCDLIMATGGFPVDLKDVNFDKWLKEAAARRAIIPTLDGRRVRASEARLVPGANCEWLPAAHFPEVAAIREQGDFRLFEQLDVHPMDTEQLRNRFEAIADLPIESRAMLISGILNNDLPKETHTPALLLDASGNVVPRNVRVFFMPSAGSAPPLPKWMELRFLNADLRASLTERLGTRDAKELQSKLASFRVVEYSLTNLASSLVASANRKIRSDSSGVGGYEAEMLRAVFVLFKSVDQGQKRPDFPVDSAVRVPNQTGKLVSVRELYLGRGYGDHGEVVQALYERWAPEKLLAEPGKLGIEGPIHIVRDFMEWLGVAPWPRETEDGQPDQKYLEYLLKNIPYPARFQDYTFDKRGDIERTRVSNVISLDGLKTILELADSTAILAWLALDDRAMHWQRPAREHATLSSRPGQTWYDRNYQGALPSYIRWTLEHIEWLPLDSVGKAAPRDCVVGERVMEALFPRPERPSESELQHYGISYTQLREGWVRAGAMPSLAHLDRDEIYDRLLELPSKSPDGQSARWLYRWLLETNNVIYGVEGRAYEEFRSRGKMWGRWGDQQGYFDVSALRHVDADGLPEHLLQHLKIVDLPRRVGTEKVERLFSIQSVDHAGIQQGVRSYQLAVRSNEANQGFQAAKPYLYKLRQSQTTQRRHLQTLKDLQLEVCHELVAWMSYEGTDFEYDVPLWGWLIVDKVVYVRADPADPVNLSSDLLADALGAALAALFRLGEGGEFARMLLCREKDRKQLLRKMRGEGSDTDLGELESEFATDSCGMPCTFPVVPPPSPSGDNLANDSLGEQASDTSSAQSGLLLTGTSSSTTTSLQPVSVEEKPHIPSPVPITLKLRIQKVTGGVSERTPRRRVTDSVFCEKKVMEFEEADNPPRFPILVSHIMGLDAPGCDILSFGTPADREAFRDGRTRDLSLVLRFVEVKGRSHAAASIELAGNELSAAERYGERYFLYRLYEESDGKFSLALLQDPLSQKQALKPVVQVNLDRAEKTHRYVLSGGILRGYNAINQFL